MALYPQHMNNIDSIINEWNQFVSVVIDEPEWTPDKLATNFVRRFNGKWEQLDDLFKLGAIFRTLANSISSPLSRTQDIDVNSEEFKKASTTAKLIWNILKEHNCIDILINVPNTETKLYTLAMIALQNIVCLVPELLWTDLKDSNVLADLWNQALDYHPELIKMYNKLSLSGFGDVYKADKQKIKQSAKGRFTRDERNNFNKKIKAATQKNPQLELGI